MLVWKHQFCFFSLKMNSQTCLNGGGAEWSGKNLLAYLMVLRTRKRKWWLTHSAGGSFYLFDALKAWNTILNCYSGCNDWLNETSVSFQKRKGSQIYLLNTHFWTNISSITSQHEKPTTSLFYLYFLEGKRCQNPNRGTNEAFLLYIFLKLYWFIIINAFVWHILHIQCLVKNRFSLFILFLRWNLLHFNKQICVKQHARSSKNGDFPVHLLSLIIRIQSFSLSCHLDLTLRSHNKGQWDTQAIK